MKVLVIGSGGREHAIVDALSRSEKVSKIFAAPGNAGMAEHAVCVSIKDTDVDKLLAFAKSESVDLTVVGPEASLALGIVDKFEAEGQLIFGPSKAATQVESSKEFAKALMAKYHIPTAAYAVFSDYNEALAYVTEQGTPIVLKYDGLAAGKGVVVAQTIEEANEALKDMLLDDKYGHGKVVVEECMVGPEFSFMCFVSGEAVYPMVVAQDHKRAYDGDKGPNTGGMGAYTELPFITEEDKAYALNEIMIPMAKAMVKEGCPFKGVLYGGLMKTAQGIRVIEFNARFGDPETEVVLPRLTSDIFDLFCAIAKGEKPVITWDNRASIGVVLASLGYPGDYSKGAVIENLEALDAKVYHMGTTIHEGKYVTNGGRVLFVTALADSLVEAQAKVNAEVEKIVCQNLFHRHDIGWQAIAYLKEQQK